MNSQYNMSSAGSPGISSVGSLGGNTNKGLRPLRPGAIERAKEFIKNKLIQKRK